MDSQLLERLLVLRQHFLVNADRKHEMLPVRKLVVERGHVSVIDIKGSCLLQFPTQQLLLLVFIAWQSVQRMQTDLGRSIRQGQRYPGCLDLRFGKSRLQFSYELRQGSNV